MSDTRTIDTGTPDLLATLEDSVLTLTLNRPDARNAMSRAMNQALQEQLAQAELDPGGALHRADRRRQGLLCRAATSRAWRPAATAPWAR